MKKMHGSFGSMPSGKARPGKGAECDHPSMGNGFSGEAPHNPMMPSNGRPGNFEGGSTGNAPKLPKEKDYSRNGL